MDTDLSSFQDLGALLKIFQYLSSRDLWVASQTCRKFRAIGIGTFKLVQRMNVSDFYKDLIRMNRGHGKLIDGETMVALLKWIHALFPNIIHLSFYNRIRFGPYVGDTPHLEWYHTRVYDKITRLIGELWPNLEILDVSGNILNVTSMHYVNRYPMIEEVRMSECDISYNAQNSKFLASNSLQRTFWNRPLERLYLGNVDFRFILNARNMTEFHALGNPGLIFYWLRDFLDDAINLKSLAIDGRNLNNENVQAIGNLSNLRSLELRNCQRVDDFSPLGNLKQLRSIVIDFGDKGTEDQYAKICTGSKYLRRIIFNETVQNVRNELLYAFVDHCRENNCRILEFQLNTEKQHPDREDSWNTPKIDVDGIWELFDACPRLDTFGICCTNFTDECLPMVAEQCPRIRNLFVNDSTVTDDGILNFFRALSQRHDELYGGHEGVGINLDVRWTKCTSDLLKKAKELYDEKMKIRYYTK